MGGSDGTIRRRARMVLDTEGISGSAGGKADDDADETELGAGTRRAAALGILLTGRGCWPWRAAMWMSTRTAIATT